MFKKSLDSILDNVAKQIAALEQFAADQMQAAADKQERIEVLTKERTQHLAEYSRATSVANNLSNLIEA